MGNSQMTIGLEFESIINSREKIIDLLPKSLNGGDTIQSVTKDSSVESTFYGFSDRSSLFLGRRSVRDGIIKRNPTYTSGFEIVTKPLTMDKMRPVIYKMVNCISRSGEIFSPRSSIHVHVGFPSGFVFIKNALSMGFKAEPLLFKIAGMGLPYRGEINNSAFARALSSPPAVKTLSKRTVLLNPSAAKSASDPDTFWNCFGIDRSGDHQRYVPLRYFGINLYSTLMRGTMEYRFFNYSSSARDVEAVTALCQFITDLMVRVPAYGIDDLDSISIFKNNPNSDYHSFLSQLIILGDYYNTEFPMSDDNIEAITDLIERTPQPLFSTKPILSHLDSYAMHDTIAKMYGLPFVQKAEEPGITNIHNFNKQEHSLL